MGSAGGHGTLIVLEGPDGDGKSTIGKLVAGREDCLFLVDGITAVGVWDIRPGRDHIDVLVSGSQKALMLPLLKSAVRRMSREPSPHGRRPWASPAASSGSSWIEGETSFVKGRSAAVSPPGFCTSATTTARSDTCSTRPVRRSAAVQLMATL